MPAQWFVSEKGTMRLCIDYRELNKKIISDKMPISRINDMTILDNFGGNTYCSYLTLDMTKAYHQVLNI